MRALDVIIDAYERLNRLSPGETLSAEDADRGFRRLNLLVDELAGQKNFLYLNLQTSAAQTGHITLGASPWTVIAPGTNIVSATVDGRAMSPLSMAQYNELQSPTQTGTPQAWAQDGLSTVYLYPVATGQTIQLLTLKGVAAFADQTTAYTVPAGYESALGAALAVRLAPNVLGRLPPELVRQEKMTLGALMDFQPAVADTFAYNRPSYRSSILNGP